MNEDDGVAKGGRVDQRLEVTPNRLGRVLAVDEGEVDRSPFTRETIEEAGEDVDASPAVELGVYGAVDEELDENVNRVHLAAVGGDPLQTAAVGGPDLDREPGPQLREHPLKSGAIAHRHLPVGGGEDLQPAGHVVRLHLVYLSAVRRRIGLVVLDLGQSETTKRCLRSIASGERRPDSIILVENGNTGEVVELGAEEALADLPVKVLRPGRNIGAAAGRNLGLNYLARNTEVERMAVLDNDTTVPPDFFQRLETAELEPLEIGAPLILDMESGEVFSAGGVFDRHGYPHHLSSLANGVNGPRPVDWAAAAALVFDRETWLRVGEFDAWYEFMFEDVEWCHRATQLGATVRLTPALRVMHEGHQSTGGPIAPARVRRWSRNGTVFMLVSVRAGARSALVWFARELRYVVKDLRSGWRGCAAARLRGVAEGLWEVRRRHRGAAPRPRRSDRRA